MTVSASTTSQTGASMHTYSNLNKAGFVLALLLGLANVASLASPTPDGEVGPPMVILLIDAVLGVGVIVAVLIGWVRARKAAIRAATVLLILTAITALPAFVSPGVPSGVVAAAGAYVLVTIITIVMMLKPARRA